MLCLWDGENIDNIMTTEDRFFHVFKIFSVIFEGVNKIVILEGVNKIDLYLISKSSTKICLRIILVAEMACYVCLGSEISEN